MKQILFFGFIFFYTSLFGQIDFKKGYYIDDSGNKIEGLIKDMDWIYNPDQFLFKTNENSEIKYLDVSNAKAVRVEGFYYISKEVQFENSPLETDKLDNKRSPNFEKRKIFLRILLDGEVDLFEYADKRKTLFFYRDSTGTINPLIYKKYIVNFKISENVRFRQQLVNDLSCKEMNQSVRYIEYKRKDLVDYFIEYNDCLDAGLTKYIENKPPKIFISPIIGVGFAEMNIERALIAEDQKLTGVEYGLGASLEYNFAFNEYKWSVVTDIFYRSFEEDIFIDGIQYDSNLRVKYNSINVFLGLKHYFYINRKFDLFLTGGPAVDLPVNSEILFADTGRMMDPILEDLDLGFGYRLGVGLDWNNKFHIGINYESRSVDGENFIDGNYDLDWRSNYSSLNLKLGYKLL